MTGRFIVLEGPDGVGKTTLAEHLGELDYATAAASLASATSSAAAAAAGPAAPLVFVGRRQVSATSGYAAELMRHLAQMLWHSGDAPDLPDAFWVGLQAAWATAHATTVTGPLLNAGYDVITDGWVYKFLSKLLIQGYTRGHLEVIFARVRVPDTVILLDADPGALYDRRHGQFRPAELGMHAGYPQLGRDTFVGYQRQGLDRLRAFAEQLGWHTVPLDPAADVEDCADRLVPILTTARQPQPATATGRG